MLRPASPPSVSERTLPSGLRVQAARRAGVPVVELRLRIPWGGTQGGDLARAVLLAESILSGTRSHDRVAFASALQALGGSLTASATVERLTIGGSALSANLEDFLALVAAILTAPAYTAGEVERDRDRLRERLAVAASQPDRQARNALLHRLYAGHPYSRELPEPDEVARVDAVAVADLHDREVEPSGALLALVGDLDPETALERVERALSGWLAGGDEQPPVPAGVTPPSVTPSGPLLLVDRPGSVQTSVRLGGAAVPRTHPGYPALKLANLLFGGYFSSRLVANLRERRGYTYSPRSGIEHAVAASTLVISADIATEVTAAGLLEIGYELGRMATLPVEAGELEAARRYAIGSLLLSTASQSGLASMLLTLGTAGLDVTFLRDHPLALAEVSTEDVLTAAREHLAPARLTTVLLGEAGRIADQVSALAPVDSR
ncbi:MAG: insulinase family protein [Nitriliruptorales bacterium]|nr:insulinase family protein [Nitriliruptorales bacterium]